MLSNSNQLIIDKIIEISIKKIEELTKEKISKIKNGPGSGEGYAGTA